MTDAHNICHKPLTRKYLAYKQNKLLKTKGAEKIPSLNHLTFQVTIKVLHLGALMDKEGAATKDIQHRLSKARQTFYRMRRIWGTSEIGRKKKVQLFKTIVRSGLMYGCEAWKLTKTEAKKLDSFQYKCMKGILIRWPQTISHQQIQEITGMNRTSDEIRRRRWN